MIDPIRPEVKAAVDECRSAGIRPVMITGDQLDTAIAIAMDLGILSDPDEAILGARLDDMYSTADRSSRQTNNHASFYFACE